MRFIFCLCFFIIECLVLDLIRYIYCKLKIKHNNRKKCFFWDCPNWHNCDFNGS